MNHVPSPVLRRLADDPLAVPDRARQHLACCSRCQERSGEVVADAALASAVLTTSASLGDADLEWALLTRRLQEPGRAARRASARPRRVPRLLARAGIGTGTVAAAGVIAAGAAAAAALTTVYAPTHVAPVRVSSSDLRAIRTVTGIGPAQLAGGTAASGTAVLPFGTLTRTAAGAARQVRTVPAASALTHLRYTGPAYLPKGTGSLQSIEVEPQVTATLRFAEGGDGIAGSILRITAGPAMVIQYGNGGNGPPALVIVVMQRPLASSSGATASELESFLLSQHGVPAGVAQQVRMLGNPGTVLPVPVPAGAAETQPTIGGAPAVLVADPSGTAAGVIWESRDGIIHGVAGLLDSREILSVARQVG